MHNSSRSCVHALLASTVTTVAIITPFSAFAQSTSSKNDQAQAQAQAQAQVNDQDNEKNTVIVTGHLIASGAESATKQNVSSLDTPFSVSAYTGAFLKTIHTTQVADLYRYMTGVQKAGSTGYDLTLRGFSTSDADRNTILVDGLPGLAVRFGSPPTVGTDHVEVVKGAASLLYGAVQPGGFVNMVTKKPQAARMTELSVRGTSGAGDKASRLLGGDISLDTTGSITNDEHLLYRFVGQISNDNTFRYNSYERGLYLSPSLTWRPDSKTNITTQMEYRQVHSNYANLFLLAPRLPKAANISYLADIRTNYMAAPDYLHESGLIESLFIDHSFSPGIKWNLSLRNVDHHDSADAFDITRYDRRDPTFQTLDLRARGQRNRRTYTFGDTYFTFHFNAIGDHRMIAGASLGREVDDFNRSKYCAINSPDAPKADPTCNPTSAQYTVRVNAPDFSLVPAFNTWGAGVIGRTSRSRNLVNEWGSGAYISDLVGFGDHIKLSLGVRYAHEHQVNHADLNEPAPVVGDATLNSSAILPQTGLIIEPNKHLSLYVSYSTSFSPVPPGTQDVNGSFALKPTTGDGYETGIKFKMPDNRATLTAAVFRIDQSNLIVASSSSACSTGNCSEQIGAARSEGIEIEGTANPLPGWSLIAGYAHTNARVTQNADTTSGPLPGGQLPNSPKDAGHIFSRYEVADGALKGFGFGLGLSVISDRIAYTPTPQLPKAFVLPHYSVADLGLYYSGKLVDLTLKVNNLFDNTYYSSAKVTEGKINVQPGIPRAILISASHKFW